MSELVPFAVAREFAIASKFNTLKEYSDFVVNHNLEGFPETPNVYREYTNVYEFLGKTQAEYKAGKYSNMVKNRDQKAMSARCSATWAKRREAKQALKVSQPVATPKAVEPTSSQFTAEQVIDILVSSNASRLYIAEFIEQHKVNPVFAVETLIKLYKSELVEAG